MKLARLLPDRQATDLLAATLLDGALAVEAWNRWTRSAGEPSRALSGDAIMARQLLPLLYDSVRRNGLPVDEETATYLRSAWLTESLRTRAYREIVAGLVSLLQAAEIPFLLIKGAAVGEMFYADPALRHAHDIEILVDDVAPVSAALAASRFHPAAGDFVHASGLPLRVHARAFVPQLAFDERTLWERPATLSSGARTLDSAHALALVLVHASRSMSRQSGRWVCDALAIQRGGRLDWRRFAQTVVAVGAALPVRVQYHWMRDAVGLEFPPEVVAALDEHAAHASAEERAIVRRGVNAGRAPWWRLWR